jgi:hypothetical protein
MALIHLRGADGFVAAVDPDRITSFGVDPAAVKKLWVLVDGKELSFSADVDQQYGELIEFFKRLNGSKSITGIRKSEGGGNGDTNQG